MANQLKIISLNCRGLGNKVKRQDIFSWLATENADIVLLQDTHWDTNTVQQVQQEWNFTLLSTVFDTRSRGCAILFKNSFEFNLGQKSLDINGNYAITEVILPENFSFVIGSIYAPNQDNPKFIKDLQSVIEDYNNPNIIVGGDWNSTRNYALDNLNYLSQNHPRTTREITSFMETLNLTDGWRVNNPNLKRYTWLQGISKQTGKTGFSSNNRRFNVYCK